MYPVFFNNWPPKYQHLPEFLATGKRLTSSQSANEIGAHQAILKVSYTRHYGEMFTALCPIFRSRASPYLYQEKK